jgi:thiol-disulfide isomerase/thioredoxin
VCRGWPPVRIAHSAKGENRADHGTNKALDAPSRNRAVWRCIQTRSHCAPVEEFMPRSQPTAPARRAPARTEIDPQLILGGAAAIIVLGLVLLYVTRDIGPAISASVRWAAAATQSAQATQSVQIAQSFNADFTLPALGGGALALSDYRGRYVLINFWATWCPPCIMEMPELHQYYQEHRDQGFVLIAINNMEDPATVEAFIRQNGIEFPVALDGDGAVFVQYDIQHTESLPSSYLIDPAGHLVPLGWPPGRISLDILERDVTPLLGG